MDRIPLINPKLIKVSAAAERAPTSVLRAEVISSTPIKESTPSQGQETKQQETGQKNTQQQEYKVTLKIGQQQLETISNNDLKKGSLLDVKVLPGPELKIINSEPQTPLATLSSTTPQAKALVQQLLADRIPQIQQQDLPNLIKQLSQIINLPINSSSQVPTPTPPSPTSLISATASENTYGKTGAKLTNQQNLANQLYLQQGKSTIPEPEIASTKSSISNTAVQQVKVWLQQLPKEQDISNSTGLRNALNGAGVQAEKQLSNLAQQSLNLADKKSANNIFQHLQSLQKTLPKEQPLTKDLVMESAKGLTNDKPELKTDLASIVKRTAKALSDNSQIVLSKLVQSRGSLTPTTTSSATNTPLTTNILTTANTSSSQPISTTSQWQNPLLSNSLMSLDDLLQSPLLQNPSSNNKFALSQILTGRSSTGQGNQLEGNLRIPLNWPERSGNDAVLIRNLQNLLGHIEREQIQQMQSAEANQGNNPNQLQQNQQWVPLLINYQQQLQLIEFYMDKEERLNQAGEKKQHWFINLHFDLPKLGKLGIEISMLDNECNTTFWSESSSALSQLSQHIKPLRQRLTEQGIVVTDIQSRHGTLEKRKHNIQQRLVDIKT